MPLKKFREPSLSRTRLWAGLLLIGALMLGAFDTLGFFARNIQDLSPILARPLAVLDERIPYRLGLDLRGGTHLVYEADLAGVSAGEEGEALEALRDVIERRVNLFGVAEPVVQLQGSGSASRLAVDLAGIRDVNAAIALIGQTPFLEFRSERQAAERDAILEAQKKNERLEEDPYFIPTGLTGRFLKRAGVVFDPFTSQPLISLELTGEGSEIFARLTAENIGKPLAIYLDGAPISAPVVQQEITGGSAQITGAFTPQEARELAGRLNSGALPVPITLIAQQSVGPSLGAESLAESLRAAAAGFISVAVFLAILYRLPGLVAVGALLFYAAAVIAFFKLIPVTLTVAGMAGFVLSLGAAVDANILVFERMREEMKLGRSVSEALEQGFSRAWSSIRDANVSTLITCAILYWLGAGVVRGFAFTLALGVAVNLVSSIIVTRTFLRAIIGTRVERVRFLFA